MSIPFVPVAPGLCNVAPTIAYAGAIRYLFDDGTDLSGIDTVEVYGASGDPITLGFSTGSVSIADLSGVPDGDYEYLLVTWTAVQSSAFAELTEPRWHATDGDSVPWLAGRVYPTVEGEGGAGDGSTTLVAVPGLDAVQTVYVQGLGVPGADGVDGEDGEGSSIDTDTVLGIALYDFDADEYPERPDYAVVRWIGPTEPANWTGYDEWREVSAPATEPDPPTNVVAVAGDEEVALSWDAPVDNGGSEITGYYVIPYIAGVDQTPVDVGLVTSDTITGLTNGTEYTFRVAAVNAVGTGAQSAESNAVTPAAAAGAPTVVQVSPVAEGGSGTMSVTPTFDSAPTEGNLMVACQYAWTALANVSTPAGWTRHVGLDSGSRPVCIYSKVAGASEAAGHTFETTTGIHQGVILLELTPASFDVSATGDGSSVSSFTVGPTSVPSAEAIPVAVVNMGNGVNETFTWDSPATSIDGTRFAVGHSAASDAALSMDASKTGSARSYTAAIAGFVGA